MFDDKTIEKNQTRMETARTGFDSLREEVARLILPRQAGFFNGAMLSQGASQTDDMTDEYGAAALEDGISAFEGFTIPRGQKWQKIKLLSERLMEPVAHQQWLEEVGERVFALRNDPKSGFTANVHESVASLLSFGEQAMWVDKRYDAFGRFAGLSYASEHVGRVWVELDSAGHPMRIHYQLRLSAEQAREKFGDEAPPKVKEAMSGSKPAPEESFEFLHVIERNERMEMGRIGPAGMPWKACYYSRKDKSGERVFKTGGYRTLRRIVSRFDRSVSEDYGRGPGIRVLPALRASQIMMQDRVLATELQVKRPMLAPDDDLDQAIVALKPWGITYGGLDDAGRERLKPLFEASDLRGALELHGEVHAVLDRAFYKDLMQINREMKTHITATRTMEEIAEKGILLSPLARQEQDWFAPMLDVELDLMREEGLLDDMPPAIAEYFAAGGGIQAIYDNNLSRMQEAGAAAGYLRTAEQVASLAQFDQSVAPMFMREYPLDKVLPGLGDVNGVPARWRATDEEKAEHDKQEREQVAAQQLLQAAPALAQAGKNAAEAEAIGGG